MQNFLFILANNIVALAAVIGATVMAVHGVSGWGWLLLVALISHTTYVRTGGTGNVKPKSQEDEK